MRFERIDLDGFADMGRKVALEPGLNVIHGPNESGKSRVIAGLLAGLCGRVKRRGRGADDLERHRPWSGARFRVELTLSLANGHRLELRQDLDDPPRSRVYDVALGRDVTNDLLVDRAPDGSRLLGLQREVVPLTMLVRQTELAAVRDGADALQEMLQRAATRDATDATANRALSRLETFRSDMIGSDRNNSKRPLREAINEEQAARRERDAIQQAQREVASMRQELATLSDCIGALVERRERARAIEARREVDRVDRVVARVLEIDLATATAPPDVPLSPDARAGLQALVAWGRSAVAPVQPHDDSRDARDLLLRLPQPPDGDTAPSSHVVLAHQARVVARQSLAAHSLARPVQPDPGPLPSLSPHRLRELAAVLEAAPPPRSEAPTVGRRTRLYWLAAAFILAVLGLAGAGIGLGAGASTVLAVGLGAILLAIGAVLLARRAGRREAAVDATVRRAAADCALDHERRAAAARELRDAGLAPADATQAHQVAARIERDTDLRRASQQWQARYQTLSEALERDEANLAQALSDRGADDYESYLAACQSRAKDASDAARRPDLERIVRTAEDEARRYAASSSAFELQRQRLADALEGAGVAFADPLDQETLDRAQRLLGLSEASERARHDAARMVAEREALLGGDTSESLLKRIESLRLLAATAPTAPSSTQDSATLLGQELTQREGELARRAGALEEQFRHVGSLAEAEERLDRASTRLVRLRRLDRLVVLAIEHLAGARDAVHRDIAPRLSSALTELLPAVTSGAWQEARLQVDTLSVSVRQQAGDWRDVTRLSTGAIEQIYLGLRAVLASAVGNPAEPAPLVLDDVIAYADPDRRAGILAWLERLATERQVIVTTSDPDVVDWAATIGAHLINLSEAL